MKISGLILVISLSVLSASALESGENVRGKRTLHILLKSFADTLGYDVMKRPPNPPNAIAKPAGDRGKVNPAGPPMPPPKTLGQTPTIKPMPIPAMKPTPAPAPPKAPPAPMAPPKAPPAPKAPPKPAVAAVPVLRYPTAPPLLTETVKKMFNINFNWNRNVATPAPMPAPAPKAPQAPPPAPQAPPPAPKMPPAPAPAPAPSQTPSAAPKAPPAPASTAGPQKHVLFAYDYDDPQIAYPQNLKDYDTYYQYDAPQFQAPLQSEAQVQSTEELKQPQEEQVQEEPVQDQKQPEQSQESVEDESNQKGNQAYGDIIQNYWKTSPWNGSPEVENKEEESRVAQIAGHNFVVSHPGGMSFSKMAMNKKVETPKRVEQNNFEPIYYYEEQQQPPLESQNLKLDQQSYNFQGPSFNQYFYFPENAETGKGSVEINSSGEKGIKIPQESRQKVNLVPQAVLPVPTHNIYQENPFQQWISPFEASSEKKEQRVQVEQKPKENVEATPQNSAQKQENGAQPQFPQWISSYEASGEQKQQNVEVAQQNRGEKQQNGAQVPFPPWISSYEASGEQNQQNLKVVPQDGRQEQESNEQLAYPQWISSYETSGEQKQNGGQAPFYQQWLPYEASAAQNQQKVEQKPQNNPQNVEHSSENFGSPFSQSFNYVPDHYSADFTAHTIPPEAQEDYSKYEKRVPIKIENEFSDKVQVSEQGFGRKYTQVRSDPLVKRKVA